MKINRLLLAAAAVAAGLAGAAHAGPILIAGTDADDHGSGNSTQNFTGWRFMQQAFTNIGNAVSNGNRQAVCLGCNGSTASAAYTNSFTLAGLAGWTAVSLTGVTDITNFFSGTGTVNVNTAGLIYMPTVSGNVSGGITDAQLAPVNVNGATLNNFVSGGGGLFAQEQANSSIGYGWLTSLLPGLNVMGDNVGGIFDTNTLQLTAQGQTQFPTLINADISNATPWHAYFTGNFGALQSLVVGNGDNVGGVNDTVVLGGGFVGGGVIVCGGPGQPACEGPGTVPEPGSMALIGAALVALVTTTRRRGRQT